MKAKTHIFPTQELLVQTLSDTFKEAVDKAAARNKSLHIAIPGGSTPKKFYQYLSGPIANEINWNFIQFYWGDERCVPPDHPESNYGMVNKTLLSKIPIPQKNIHRIHGEDIPEREVRRYAKEIKKNMPASDLTLPQFDWIILGLGEDGHTASLFPNMNLSTDSNEICIVARQPQSGQKRISLTLTTINYARRVSFLATGESKASVVASSVIRNSKTILIPAAQVMPNSGNLDWFLDESAASNI